MNTNENNWKDLKKKIANLLKLKTPNHCKGKSPSSSLSKPGTVFSRHFWHLRQPGVLALSRYSDLNPYETTYLKNLVWKSLDAMQVQSRHRQGLATHRFQDFTSLQSRQNIDVQLNPDGIVCIPGANVPPFSCSVIQIHYTSS